MTGVERLRAFVLDDEPLAVKRLARMLEATGRVEIVGRATDPEDGLAQVAAQAVDVLFVDIHMPGLTGFQVVERLPAGPMIVFTTAHDQHAVQAFEVNAVDYLLKPIERERLDRALDRLLARRAGTGEDWRGALERLARHLRASTFLDHLASLVNVTWIAELHPDEDGHLLVCLKDPRRTELAVSRDRVRALKERLALP